MEQQRQKQALMQRLNDLQMLIDGETSTTYKQSLEKEKANCLNRLIELNKQTAITQTTDTQPTHQEVQSPQPPVTPVVAKSQPPIPNIISEKYVSFHNDVNSVSLGKLGALETNLLFATFHKLKEKQDELLVFEAEDIKSMIGSKTKVSLENLSKIVERLWKNIRAANFWILYPRAKENLMLFNRFHINYHDTQKTQVKSMEIQMNMPYFGYLLNFLNANFTSFELLEFQNINGKYAKTLYRFLKQWKSTGVPPKMEWGKFRELMGISNNIKLLRVLKRDILKPAIQELNKLPHFKNLCYEKLKTKGMGNRITHIQFYFQPVTKTSKDREQAKRDIRTIAWKIRSDRMLKELQRSRKQTEQKQQDELAMEILGHTFQHPQQLHVTLVIDQIQPVEKGYEFVLKYYNRGQEVKAHETHAVLPNKEALLEQIARANWLKIADYPLHNPYQQHSPQAQTTQKQPTPQQQSTQTQQLTQTSMEFQQEPNGFKTFKNLTRGQQPSPQQPTSYKDILGSYICRTLYMNSNGVPSSLKITDITTLASGHIQVDIQDVDKPHKSLKPFSFDSAKHFENWFRKYVE
ncbi:replication initiation protein [Helicobacter bizzozeronii]|uniref:replication initiation protein n=1 Tax=Helicobacter bizzozeronii TaxID=56877 RepID=UPI0013152829|nr:replication initiation protein [Helicobacter bizzozeronii]